MGGFGFSGKEYRNITAFLDRNRNCWQYMQLLEIIEKENSKQNIYWNCKKG
jgi:hypothetical protein